MKSQERTKLKQLLVKRMGHFGDYQTCQALGIQHGERNTEDRFQL